jgi:hypothetical protein
MRKQSLVLGTIIVIFTALCVFYNFATPLFEGVDEGPHYNYVNFLATHGALPDLNSPYIQAIAQTHHLPNFETDPNALGQEVTQPPLYYAAGAALIFWIDRSDFTAVYKTADTMLHGMTNFHTPAELAFPPTGTVLAVRIVRFFSTLIGVALILLVYKIAKQLTHREDVAILASGITAFNPKFIHISSVITNDIAVACAFTLALYISILLITTTVHDARRFIRLSIFLGLSIGLAALSKYSGLSVLMPSGIALIWYALKFRKQIPFGRTFWPGVLACGASFVIIAGWFFLHNWLRYGDMLAWTQVQQANMITFRGDPLPLSGILASSPMLFRSYWGIFGDGIQSAVEYDWPVVIVTVIGVCGALVAALRKRIPAETLLLIVSAIATLIAFASWTRMYAVTDNSRLIMPVTATVSIFLSVGLLNWVPSRVRIPFAYGFSGCAVLWALYIPTVSLLPNYNPLSYLTPQQVAGLPAGENVLFENGIELYSVAPSADRVQRGDNLDLTLYWRATRPITQSYATVIEAFDAQHRSLGRLSTEGYLGRQFVTSEWEPGRVIGIHYRLNVTASQQTLARIFVGWYLPNSDKVVRVQDKHDVSAPIATIKVRGPLAPEQPPDKPFTATFGDSIQLEGYKACADMLTLYWRSTGTPGRDYTVFVHALDQQGNLVGQSDAPVFYPTEFWDAGEQILDMHPIKGLGHVSSIGLGLYDSVSKDRLLTKRPDGTSWTNNVVTIPIVQAASCP